MPISRALPLHMFWLQLLLCVAMLLSGAAVSAANIAQLRQQAEAGDAQAQFQLAESYYRGEGTARNYAQALKWYRTAAENGHAKAQYQMGYLHQHGPAMVDKDDSKAFEWYLKAAKQGHVSAQTKVSLMYQRGKGVARNPAQARKWSMEVLKSKGLLEEEPAPAAVKKPPAAAAKRPPAAPAPAKKPATKARPAPATKPRASAKAKPKAKPGKQAAMTPEQKKAWRREQARKLVEKMNREASATVDWSDVDDE